MCVYAFVVSLLHIVCVCAHVCGTTGNRTPTVVCHGRCCIHTLTSGCFYMACSVHTENKIARKRLTMNLNNPVNVDHFVSLELQMHVAPCLFVQRRSNVPRHRTKICNPAVWGRKCTVDLHARLSFSNLGLWCVFVYACLRVCGPQQCLVTQPCDDPVPKLKRRW